MHTEGTQSFQNWAKLPSMVKVAKNRQKWHKVIKPVKKYP